MSIGINYKKPLNQINRVFLLFYNLNISYLYILILFIKIKKFNKNNKINKTMVNYFKD